ncbi:RusA family crossover junction endodeoxyribonuclease [Cedecea sp. P7760]|uniref:RusA family crossover junction endodeoxyribonuclease n=1 Tax=Cedecea sp. P7760 TaxID=2726983 RepID=UPI0015A4C56A|nr:RusA family crossover junction endodeoxyribonuclease [Cedecea sp. P7760]NWC66026.1 RusA family crossover junction endodeoxyribonuclease [Cedecea sp. P7760]
MKVYNILPMGKPRMTRADKWKKRLEVLRYRAFCDEVRLNQIELPECGYHVIFVLPMPPSWSKKKQAEYDGKPHQSRPDKDNLEKALLDALFGEDSHIWDGRVSKIWGTTGKIIIREAESCALF